MSCSAIPHSKKRSGKRSRNATRPQSRRRSASSATSRGSRSRLLDERLAVGAGDEPLALLRRRAVLRRLGLDELDRRGARAASSRSFEPRLDLARPPARTRRRSARRSGSRRARCRCAAGSCGSMNETPPPLSVSAIDQPAAARSSCERRRASRRTRAGRGRRSARPPSRTRATFASRSPRSLTCDDPRVRLHLVAVDDHGDLVQAAVRGRLERLPELPLLQLAVAGEHVDAARAAEQRGRRARSRAPSRRPCRASRCSSRPRASRRRRGGRGGRRGGAAGGSARSRAGRARSARRTGRARRGPSRRSSGRPRRSTSRWSHETMSSELKVVPGWPEPARSIM